MPLSSFLCKAEVVELGGSDELSGKGRELALFLFSDVLEISKKRGSHATNGGRANERGLGGGGGLSAGRSPSTMSLRGTMKAAAATSANPSGGGGGGGNGVGGTVKPHKHIDLMGLSSIRRVVDLLVDSDEYRDCFALICRTNQVGSKN